jgi:hypothetical protein
MTNRIRNIRVRNGRLDPAEAEIWLSVDPERLTSTTQVRGRLMGPRCPYATTVEVAYPLREHSREYESLGIPHLTLRVIIPEASLWDPQSPFLYQGPVELWQNGQRCDQVQLSHGLRTLNLGPQGLRCNGRLLPLRGVARTQCTEEDARQLHQAGCNTLLVPATASTAGIWDISDRFGFFVLGGLTDQADFSRVKQLAPHVSCLGWVLSPEVWRDPLVAHCLPHPVSVRQEWIGLELDQRPSGPLPEKIQFVACSEDLLPELGAIDLPKIVLGAKAGDRGTAPDILGWIDA